MTRVSPPELAREFPGPHAIQQRNASALTQEMQRCPAAKRTRPDNSDVRFVRGHSRQSICQG